MKFLVDNALSPVVSQRLRDAGYDSVHVRDIGLAAADDQAIFDAAAAQDRAIVSADTDFGTLLALRQQSRPSVILFRGNITRKPDGQAAVLVRNLPSIASDIEAGSIAVFDGLRMRIRQLPL